MEITSLYNNAHEPTAHSHTLKKNTDNTDATDFIFSRISFSLGFFWDFIAPNGAGLPQAQGKSV